MENKSHALAAGLFVVVLTALVIGLGLWLGRDNTTYTKYELSTLDSVSGLQLQAPVRYKGVPVGKVTSIEFDPEKNGKVLIIVAVSAEAPITQTTYAMLGFQGVTGLAHIQLDDDNSSTTPLPPGPDGLPRLPMRPSPFGQIAEQGPVIMQQVEDATRRVNDLLSDSNQRELMTTVASLGQAAQSLDALSKRLQLTVDTKLDPALASLPAVAQDVRKALAGIDKTSKDVGKAVSSLASKGGAVDQMATAVEQVSNAADNFNRGTLPNLDRTMNEVSSAARRLGDTADSFKNNPQSLIYGPTNALPGPGEKGFVAPVPAGASR
ncbi:MAG: MlaD family protein [Comamonas sp.]